jgi:Flp pilus assembly protein TadD
MGRSGAKALLLQILEQRPDDPPAYTLLGILEFRGGKCTAALEHFAKAAPVLAHQPEALTADGTCLTEMHRDEEAATAFAQALALDPNRGEARYNLALAQWDAHHPADAWTALEPLVKKTPVDDDVLDLAVDILDAQSSTAQALALMRSAVLANPKDSDAYLRFATLSFDYASPQVGVDILNVGLTQLPNQARLHLVRGILPAQMGEFARAADDFDRANRIDPHSPVPSRRPGCCFPLV